MSPEQRKWHFGVLSFTGTGHVNPLIALSQELRDRGHQLTFFEKPKIADRVRRAGLGFCAIDVEKFSAPSKRPAHDQQGFWSELWTLRFNLQRIAHDIESYLRELPPALIRAGVDALLINEIAVAGPTLAELSHLPYFIISTSVPHNFGWKAFPWYSGYKYTTSLCSPVQSELLEVSALHLHGPICRALDRCRQQLSLGPAREAAAKFPALAQITQLPQCLDLPREAVPTNFHYAGPFIEKTPRPSIEFPWDRLDGRTIIYASLGTTRNVQANAFRMIAEACRDLELQLVISLGNRFEPELFRDLPGDPMIAKYVPQLDLLKHAAAVITHGGCNTTLESLMEGKPMIVIPIAYDQPAIAVRLKRLKAAEVLPIMRLSTKRIRAALIKVLHDPGYREAAAAIQDEMRSIEGTTQAADVIEGALGRYAMEIEPYTQAECSTRQRDGIARGSMIHALRTKSSSTWMP